MITIRLTLRVKRQVWHLVNCEVDGPDQWYLAQHPPVFHRKFVSQEAAIAQVTHLVARRLKQQPTESGSASETVCVVTIVP